MARSSLVGRLLPLAVAAALVTATDARAAFLDLTAISVSNNLGTAFTLNDVLPGISVEISSQGGAITATAFDGGASTGCQPAGPLQCTNDGLGVSDDEVTASEVVATGESLTFKFSELVSFTGFSFLDLYKQVGSTNSEKASISIDGTVLGPFAALVNYQLNGGYGDFVIAPIQGQTLVFTMLAGAANNDGEGKPDAAIASLTFTQIPLPAAGWLLVAGLAGLASFARRRRDC